MRLFKWALPVILMLTLIAASVCQVSAVQYFYDGAYHEYQGNTFQLKVNGKLLKPEMPPIVFNDYSVVPARSVFQDGLGAKVLWNGKTREVTVVMGNDTLIMTIDKTDALFNGVWVTMPIAPKIINDYTMIPARFVGETFHMNVNFDSKTDTVMIDNKQNPSGNQSGVQPVTEVPVLGVSLSEAETEYKLIISTASLQADYSEYFLQDPLRLVIDIKNGKFVRIPGEIEGKGNLLKIRFGQQTDYARIVFDLTEDLGYSVVRAGTDLIVTMQIDPNAEPYITDIFKVVTYGYEGGRDFIRFDVEKGEAVKNGSVITVPVYGLLSAEAAEKEVVGFFGQKMSYTPSEGGGTVTIMLKADAEMYVQDNEVRLKSIYRALPRSVMLDAGHGGQDSGAVGYHPDGSVKALEKDFNLDVTLRAKALLEAHGVDVHTIRTNDVYVDYRRVGSISNDAGTSLFVSIHTNSATVEQANGIETFGYLQAGSVSNGMTSKRLSEILLEELIKETGANNRGVKDGKSLAVVNSTKMPATLIEIGFISNPDECAKMMTEAYRQKLAEAVCNGVLRAFEEMGI